MKNDLIALAIILSFGHGCLLMEHGKNTHPLNIADRLHKLAEMIRRDFKNNG